jgi:hypothetical protein
MENENWKDIPNFPNYQISTLGRVKSKKRTARSREKLLKQQKHPKGYRIVRLFKDGEGTQFLVHRLMGIVFFGVHTELGKTTIDHDNGIKSDNRLSNLKVMSHRSNISKGYLEKETTSKYTGVSRLPNGSYSARICNNGVQNYIGTFPNEEDAHLAYQLELNKIIEPKRVAA